MNRKFKFAASPPLGRPLRQPGGYVFFCRTGYGSLPPGTATLFSPLVRGGSPVKIHGPFPSLFLTAAAVVLFHAQPSRCIAAKPLPSPSLSMTAEQRGDLFMARQQYLAAIDAYRQAPPDAVTL